MPTLRRKRESEYLQLRPYREIAAPKLRSQKERDHLAYGNRGFTPVGLVVKSPRAPRFARRTPYVVVAVAVLLLALGLLWLLH